VDFGAKRIGLALSDRDWQIASPKTTIPGGNVERVGKDLAALVKENRVGGIVWGLPLDSAGGETQMSLRSRNFARSLDQRMNIPLLFWDERLTSFMAGESLMALGMRSSRAPKGVIDRVAAAHILQSLLDRLGLEG
jgi:putative Holliday junction resolvase